MLVSLCRFNTLRARAPAHMLCTGHAVFPKKILTRYYQVVASYNNDKCVLPPLCVRGAMCTRREYARSVKKPSCASVRFFSAMLEFEAPPAPYGKGLASAFLPLACYQAAEQPKSLRYTTSKCPFLLTMPSMLARAVFHV